MPRWDASVYSQRISLVCHHDTPKRNFTVVVVVILQCSVQLWHRNWEGDLEVSESSILHNLAPAHWSNSGSSARAGVEPGFAFCLPPKDVL